MPAPLPPERDTPEAPLLFCAEVMSQLTDEEAREGKYTLARLPPEKEREIVQLLLERRSAREVQRLVHVHQETVRLVADKHAAEIDAANTNFAKKLRRINWALADRMEKEATSFPLQAIPLAIKLNGEHAELLEGRATERVEHVVEVDIHAAWQSFKDEAEKIGLPGEKNLVAAELVPGDAPAVVRGFGDPRSEGPGDSAQENPGPIDGFIDGSTPETGRRAPGPPGGGSGARAHESASKDQTSQKILQLEDRSQ